MNDEVLEREIRGERLLLHPERALSWPARSLLVVADTHFGKSAVFARHGIAVPAGTDALDRERLDRLLLRTGATRLLVLGDFLHGPVMPGSAAALELEQWLQRLRPVQFLLVTGNHDRTAARGWQASTDWQGEQLVEGPFCFTHDAPSGVGAAAAFHIGGHIHPVVALGARRKRRMRVPVFWEREDALVMPSFGLFTGGQRIEPDAGGRIFAAGPEHVVELRWRRED